ncbi:MAG: peptidylprolyl isomerase [bacterium]
MVCAKRGDRVKVQYTGKLMDGTVFDSNTGQEPLEFEIGVGDLIPGFENGIVGVEVGETKSILVTPEEGYGERDEEMVWEVSKNTLPDDVEPRVGVRLKSVHDDGMTLHLLITAVSEASVTLDANHPLAGKDLLFDIELLEIL